MNTRRQGFTLVELMIVAVLSAIVLGAAVQSLVIQERSYRTTGEIIRGQDALRTAFGVLESELREVATMGTVGGSDILTATADSLAFRAQRKIGFVCSVLPSDRRMTTWSVSQLDQFTAEEGVLVYRDDDTWVAARASNVTSSTAGCPSKPATIGITADQRINLHALDGQELEEQLLVGVLPGAPVRAFQRVTYGLRESDTEWVLSRREGASGEWQTLVGGLAASGSGLVFTYLDSNGDPLASPVNPSAIAAVRIDAASSPRTGSGARPLELTTTIFFRNN